jgi:kinetochore protein Nuf2
VPELQRVYEKLVECTVGTTREEMAQPVFAGLQALNYGELHDESIPELAFFRACAKMMEVSCVTDFSLKDMLHPTKARLRRHLSAVINFCKFREDRMKLYNDLASKKEQAQHAVDVLQNDQERLERELQALKDQTEEEAQEIEEVESECRLMEGDIGSLNSQQAAIRQESTELKRQGNDLKDRISSLALDLKEAALLRERLLGQIVNSPTRIRREMADQQAALEAEKSEALDFVRSAQQKELCCENVAKAHADVQKAVTSIEEVAAELSKQRDALKEVKVTQKTVEDNRAKSSALRAETASLQRQLQRWDEKLAHLRKQARAKIDQAGQVMVGMQTELQAVERERSDGLSKAEAAEAEAMRLGQTLTAQQEQARAEREDMMDSFRGLEAAILSHSKSLRAAVSNGAAPAAPLSTR